MMPGATGKKIWATLSPVSYLAFKLLDNQFEEKETFRHTGVRLRLAKGECDFFYVNEPLNVIEEDHRVSSSEIQADETTVSSSSSSKLFARQKSSTKTRDMLPDVAFHLGKAYTDNVASVRTELDGLSLNDVYQTKVAPLVAMKGLAEEGEQS